MRKHFSERSRKMFILKLFVTLIFPCSYYIVYGHGLNLIFWILFILQVGPAIPFIPNFAWLNWLFVNGWFISLSVVICDSLFVRKLVESAEISRIERLTKLGLSERREWTSDSLYVYIGRNSNTGAIMMQKYDMALRRVGVQGALRKFSHMVMGAPFEASQTAYAMGGGMDAHAKGGASSGSMGGVWGDNEKNGAKGSHGDDGSGKDTAEDIPNSEMGGRHKGETRAADSKIDSMFDDIYEMEDGRKVDGGAKKKMEKSGGDRKDAGWMGAIWGRFFSKAQEAPKKDGQDAKPEEPTPKEAASSTVEDTDESSNCRALPRGVLWGGIEEEEIPLVAHMDPWAMGLTMEEAQDGEDYLRAGLRHMKLEAGERGMMDSDFHEVRAKPEVHFYEERYDAGRQYDPENVVEISTCTEVIPYQAE